MKTYHRTFACSKLLISALVLILIPLKKTEAAQDSFFIQAGVGVGHPDKEASADKSRLIEVGGERHYKIFDARFGMGGFTDKTKYPGVRPSVFTQVQVGLSTRPKEGGLYAGIYFGPGFISNPDSMLGGHFQFVEQVNVGLSDLRGVRVGFFVKHFSNAGIEQPNKGRNFVGLQAAF